MSRLRSFLDRPPAERRALTRAVGAVAGVRLLLWLLPYRAVSGLVGGAASSARRPSSGGAPTAERIAADVARAGRVVPRATCLVQALAGEWLIARAGLPVDVRYGVTLGERGLEAHAWLESEGRVILGGESAARFTALRPPEGPAPRAT